MSDFDVMSCNLRNASAPDGDDAWPQRRERVQALLRAHPCAVHAFQEVLPEQLVFLDRLLPDYQRIGVGRDDGRGAGEHVPIYCRRDQVQLYEGGCFWLSDTPDEPGSRSWGSACPRIVTWARLGVGGGQELTLCNLHLDHASADARRRGCELLCDRLWELAEGAVVVLGDFNCGPDEEPCRVLCGEEVGLREARQLVGAGAVGPAWSFHAFDPPGEVLIDHVFVSPEVAVRDYALIEEEFAGGWPSDHLPVKTRLAFA